METAATTKLQGMQLMSDVIAGKQTHGPQRPSLQGYGSTCSKKKQVSIAYTIVHSAKKFTV
jgi:hypothetical protein